MSATGRVYQFLSYLLYIIAKENGEGKGDSTLAVVVERIMQKWALEASSSTIE